MSYHLLSKLSRDLCQLLDTCAYYDVLIRVGKGSSIREFPAHSLILRARSGYFRGGLANNKVKMEYDKIIFNKPSITPIAFEIILNGKVDFMNINGKQVLDLLFAAEELGLMEILELIQDYLINNQTVWMDKNFVTYHRAIYRNDSFKTLQVYYTEKLATNPAAIFQTLDLFNPDVLNALDNSGCIRLNEVFWGYIVNWSRFQIPKLNNEVTGWAKDDWISFKQSLSQCIPWKSIDNMEWDAFHDLIIPCEPFLPPERFDIALNAQLKKSCDATAVIRSPISLQFNATIINICHATLLSSWIDQLNNKIYRPAEIPYEFKLVLNGKRDGFTPEVFHRKCNKMSRTLVIFKTANSKSALYGGYNPLDWEFDRTTKDSFTFHFDYRKAEINRLDGCAILNKQGYGPCFGNVDLFAFPDGNRRILWRTNDNDEGFLVEDYEVFQVVEKLKRTNYGSSLSHNPRNHHVHSHKKR
nr:13431_t:CDS:2 [Entrophospora candida]CAG8528337.1 3250_t:CDS:2 [Entrophospora candida]